MRNGAVARWVPATAVAAVAALEVAVFVSDGQLLVGLLIGALLAALAWWQSPLRLTRSVSHRRAQELHHNAVVVYWRPGCWYCTRLRALLGPTRRTVVWVNVWADAAASDFVRGLHRGDEIVPTVLIGGVGGTVLTNPDPGRLRQRLQGGQQ